MDSQINLEEIAKKVETIARQAGQLIHRESNKVSPEDIEEKGLYDLVSYVDRAAEEFIVEALQPLIPEAGFIAEENADYKPSDAYNWIIDPLDGTTNFIHKVPVFSVSIALTFKGELVIGAVYEVNRDESFLAWKKGGAYLNGNRIKVTENQKLANSLLATGFPFRSEKNLDEYLSVLKTLMQSCRGLRRMGSAAVDLAYVACGRFDCFFEFNLQNYDMAAGILLVKEAGGLAYDFTGAANMLEKGSVIAGNPTMTELVYQIIRKDFG